MFILDRIQPYDGDDFANDAPEIEPLEDWYHDDDETSDGTIYSYHVNGCYSIQANYDAPDDFDDAEWSCSIWFVDDDGCACEDVRVSGCGSMEDAYEELIESVSAIRNGEEELCK